MFFFDDNKSSDEVKVFREFAKKNYTNNGTVFCISSISDGLG